MTETPDNKRIKRTRVSRGVGFSKNDEEALDVSGLSRVFARNPRLLEGGSPNPLWAARNIEDFGHSCPEREFVVTANRPDFRELSKKWGVAQHTIQIWKRDGKWLLLRREFWKRQEERAREREGDALQRLQENEQELQLAGWQLMRDKLMSDLRRGEYETMSPKGDIRKVPIGARDVKDIAAALKTINEGVNEAIGLTKTVRRLSEKEGPENSAPVRRMQYNLTVEEVAPEQEEITPPKELPEPSLLPDPLEVLQREGTEAVVEGEVEDETYDNAVNR